MSRVFCYSPCRARFTMMDGGIVDSTQNNVRNNIRDHLPTLTAKLARIHAAVRHKTMIDQQPRSEQIRADQAHLQP
eukprot:scaffold629905_cov19-Prasinocladus_malaysianus.AAC.1